MTAKKRVLVVFSLVATVLALAVVPFSQASAADISLEARPIWSNIVPSFTCLVYTVGVYNNECINLNSDITVSISDFTFLIPEGINVTSGTTVMQLELLFDNYQDNNSIDGNFLRARFQSGNFGLIDVATSSQGATGYMVRLTFIAERSFTTKASDNSNRYTVYNPLNSTELAYLKPGERMVISNVGLYNLSGDGSQAIVNAINNNNSTSAVNDAKSAIVGAINEQKQAQQQANSDANDRYQDEKDTINDSRDEAEATADSMDTSGFNIANPFLNWLGLFTDNACVSIPTMKTWLHSTESNICSPWRNTPVRGVLTPIFSLLGTMLVTGFVFRWLRSNNTEGTIEGI